MSKNECLAANWQAIGFEDGAAGRSTASIGERRQACGKHGISIDLAAYDAGYNDGIRTFCSYGRGHESAIGGYSPLNVCPTNTDYHSGYQQGLEKFCTRDSGYDFGLAGGNYRRTCSPVKEVVFMQGFAEGREIFDLRNTLYNLEDELQNIVAAREHNKQDQESLKKELVLNSELTSEDRAQILLDIDALRDEDDELKYQKGELQGQILDVQYQLSERGIEL